MNSATNSPSWIHEIDALIKQGNLTLAKHQFAKLNLPKLTPDLRLAYCTLARRLDLPTTSLRLLNRIVRPTGRKTSHATEEEQTEYAACLVEIGAEHEATQIFEALDTDKNPEILLYRSFAYFSQWNYAASLPLLSQYISHSKTSDYQRIVGSVNLAAALVHERSKKARSLLHELERSTRTRYPKLYANVTLLEAEQAVYEQDWGAAEKHLEKTNSIFKGTQAVELLFIRKWQAVIDASRNRKLTRKVFSAVRKESLAVGQWETIRDCDRFQAMIERNHELILRVYFGSPWKQYRQWLLQEFPEKVLVPETYLRTMDSDDGGTPKTYHLFSPHHSIRRLKSRQLLSRLYMALNSDFYAPIRLAEIYSKLFPEEYFNPFSSPNRVHQAVARMKSWFKAKRLPLEIKTQVGGYWITASKPCRIEIPQLGLSHELSRFFPSGSDFTTEDACKPLGLSARSTRRLLQKGVAEGTIEREGKKRATRYRIA